MSDDSKLISGKSEEYWKAAYRPGIEEFSASTYAFFVEEGFVRIAFGNLGPPVLEPEGRTPVFTHAVTLTARQALDLSRKLRDVIAGPPNSTEPPSP